MAVVLIEGNIVHIGFLSRERHSSWVRVGEGNRREIRDMHQNVDMCECQMLDVCLVEMSKNT